MSCSGCLLFCFFFFKQKTAYEMRISDWSSDVCSSDLLERVLAQLAGHGIHDLLDGDHALWATEAAVGGVRGQVGLAAMAVDGGVAQVVGVVGVEHEIGRASCRERVCQYV